MSKLNFDANKIKPQAPMEAIPKADCGWMPAIVVESAVEPTKTDAKNGQRLALTFEIIGDGAYAGRKIWDGLNIKNSNPVATEIGQGQLSALCHAANALVIAQTEELHNKPLEILVGYEAAQIKFDAKGNPVMDASGEPVEEYPAKNKVKGFRPFEGAAATAAGTSKAAPAWAGKTAIGPSTGPKHPPAEPTPEADPTTAFWVYINDDSVEKTRAEIGEMIGQGMPLDTKIQLKGVKNADWQDASEVFAAHAPTPAPTPTPPAPAKKPTPAAPTPPKATGTPPWAKKA